MTPGEVGLVVWSENGSERFQEFRGTWKQPKTPQRDQEPVWLVSDSQGTRGSDTASPSSIGQLTTQLDPLLCPSVIKALPIARATGFLTPADGSVLLGPRLTIRRSGNDSRGPPSGTAVLTGGGASLRIDLKKDVATAHLSDISQLPAPWKDGLPSGPYTLRFENNPPAHFQVESTARREQVTAWLTEWRQSSGENVSGVDTLVAVEYLASQQPQPYLADALDVLDDLDPKQITPYLQATRRVIIGVLQTGVEPPPPDLEGDSTGIVEIDRARRLIALGRWEHALRELQSLADLDDARSRALADLYRGVIHAESGMGQEQAADFYFRRAISGLNKASAVDKFRAHNNYANFLLNRSQDRLFNHAFQMAAGIRRLFITAISNWEEARVHYEVASGLAIQLGRRQQASIKVNLARLHSTLADVIGTLESPEAGQHQLREAEQAENQKAEQLAQSVAGLTDDPFVRSVAETILAQVAFRARDFQRCREHALSAEEGFARAGSVVGIESTERLLGLISLRASQFDELARKDPKSRQAALSHFRRSHLLSELLRGQVPADRVGLTRAGFFARRVYVNDRIVELLIEDGREVEALQYVELAKARALQDLLATAGTVQPDEPDAGSSVGSTWADRSGDLEVLLRRWPTDVVALEYYLTNERAWVFGIAAGKVQVYAVLDDAGQPLSARDLVGQVRSVLSDVDNYAVKMQKRILDGSGFDHTWQDRFDKLSRLLVPKEVRAKLSKTRTLLIVPHHILHYFPFAALVMQPDAAQRGPLEMVQPRFLVDETCNICYAPSLTVWDDLRQRPDRAITEATAIGIAGLPGMQPLPGVAAELQSLRATLAGRLKLVLTDEDAHVPNALALLKQAGFLLIGTHGQNWPDEPLTSELFLYPRGSDAGRLTASQLYLSEVGRDLIVLSACYTALADKSPLPGDDLFGLQRALLQSGGRTVVAGQWDIYDRSGPELMHAFFNHLSEGIPAHEALAMSQREFLARLRSSGQPEPWLHPYFWAVFTVCGDDRVRFQLRQ